MKYGMYVITGMALTIFVLCGHYAARSYFNARHLKAQAETMTVRTRLMKHQVGELEQKARTLNRVQHFVDTARAQRLTPENWSVYEVQVQNALAFPELARIVEQCAHNRDLYFQPISFHVAVGQDKDVRPEEGDSLPPAVSLDADAGGDGPADVALALQGRFLVRH